MFEDNLLINLISNIGFPIVITIYLLLSFERKIEGLQQAIQSLSKEIDSPKNKE
ncbi:YvrJ family protein [Solibacillus sp. FSL R7-0682]|jgi:hypothetical protein|uniref:YvrJ family protein n=1 Tax=Solibacillus sp. FSL R7-0682 TaxID=2921690 RepID=UPI0030FC6CEE